MANLLNLNIIPVSQWITLCLPDASPMPGVLMAKARGYCIMRIQNAEERRAKVSGELLCNITPLNLLDAINHEIDHYACNYNVVETHSGGERLTTLEAFENSGAGAFSPTFSVSFSDYKQCSPFIVNGTVNRPHLDRAVATRLRAITLYELYSTMKGTLPVLNTLCLWVRMKKVVRAIANTEKRHPGFLLDKNLWNNDAVEEDLSGRYGKTYLTSMIHDYLL